MKFQHFSIDTNNEMFLLSQRQKCSRMYLQLDVYSGGKKEKKSVKYNTINVLRSL